MKTSVMKKLNKLRFAPFLLAASMLLLIKCNSTEGNKGTNTTQEAKIPLTYREQINKPLIVNFGDSAIYELLYKSDSSFQWISVISGKKEDVKSKTIVLDEYKVLTHWIEKDSTTVSILTDFENMTVNGFETFNNYESIYLIGKLTEKE